MTLRSPELRDAYAAVRQDKARQRKARKEAAREYVKTLVASKAPGKKDPRQRDAAYLSWLHDDIPCIACLIEGPSPEEHSHIEAAHQKLAIASKGWLGSGLGPRAHDARCAPLCAWHHRISPSSCDVGGQRKFWDRLGLYDTIADFCKSLHSAFLAGQSGKDVVVRYSRIKL